MFALYTRILRARKGKLTWEKIKIKLTLPGFRVILGLSCVIGPLGRQGPAATFGQPCPQMTRRPGTLQFELLQGGAQNFMLSLVRQVPSGPNGGALAALGLRVAGGR